jgi:hypothetical protein
MVPARDFMTLMEVERKFTRQEPLNAEDWRVWNLYGRMIQPKLCSCGCGEPLEPRVDGERHTIGGKEVNSDCYFNSFGDELEKFPIVPLRLRR